ncbi:histidine kinase [Cellulophaga algicola DSM 14237]|uniref:histidine kinase n=1 Tax=Cellulophaga algicola (strain DSM 14237 / IC166 / ACAM 630) TaxID=688270 RepID=E6X497_CELAD|nr:tetratricopeptide repeat-containing sensor histidine kinase [Cellulophaga algicola]ADV51480.1 histidine kinase [Cellulophaga algicola DSM 14237]
MKRPFVLFIFLQFFNPTFTYSQSTQLDSLYSEVHKFQKSENFDTADHNYINLLNLIGKEYYFKNIDSLYYYSQKAQKLSSKTKYVKGSVLALAGISHCQSYKGQNDKAIKSLEKAYAIANETKDSKLQILALNRLGILNYDIGNHAEALKAYLMAIEIATATNDILNLSFVKENIAHLYLAQKDYKQSLTIYKEIQKLNHQLGEDVYKAQSSSNIADLYVKLKDFKNAKIQIDSSITILEENEENDWLAYSYMVKGDMYLKQNRVKLALHWYEKALILHEDLNDDRSKAQLLNSLSEAYLKLYNYTKAEENAIASLEIGKRLSLLDDSKTSNSLLYEINKSNNKVDSALKYHEVYKLLSDSISRKENLNSLGILKTKLEFEKQQKDAKVVNEKAKARQDIYIYLALITLAILALIIFLLRKQSKARNKFNIELRLKTTALEKREEELNAINATKDKLFSIIGHDLRGPINALASVLNMLKEDEITQEEFLEFTPKVKSDVDAISFTLNNLLSWGRTQMTGSKTEPSFFDIHDLVTENIKLLQETAKNKSILITNTTPNNTRIWADINQIDVVIRNLLSNAIKFSYPEGIISVNAIVEDSFLKVSIKDKGVGISTESLDEVFNSKNATLTTTYGTSNEKGTGLGLSLCKEMVNNNGGEIYVESKINEGSIFYFTIPLRENNTK